MNRINQSKTLVFLNEGTQAHGMDLIDMGKYIEIQVPIPHLFVSATEYNRKTYPRTSIHIPLRNGQSGAEIPTCGTPISMKAAKDLLHPSWWPIVKKAVQNVMHGKPAWK